uniref:ribosomal protein L14 n=1 Tax=Cephaleuros virescens TaxID=173371 RepID=UPI001EE0A8A0|nr:ribosomal protein L14 [Cephaleuros virescens]UIB38686.1 ribosomal protein L14 [Cephaleuros virescens]
MITNQSYLKVADNRGAKEVMVIHVMNSQIANIGDKVVAVVKEALPNMTIKKSDVVTAVVVRTKKGINRNGTWIRFQDNAGVIIQKESGNPRGSRIFGGIPKELRALGFTKIVSLASDIL